MEHPLEKVKQNPARAVVRGRGLRNDARKRQSNIDTAPNVFGPRR
jgi:hypothetical protein